MEKFLKSPCCKAGVRAEVRQSCRVEVKKKYGTVDCDDDFSDPEINDENMWCEDCAKQLMIVYNEDTKDYRLEITDTN